MSKILAFAGSNHSKSINHSLVEFTASLINDHEVTVLDIRSWKISMYSIDMDPDDTPVEIIDLLNMINEYDGFIISSPEHNGGVPAFLKNIIDWISRRAKNAFNHKPVLLMSTSPGAGGGSTNLKYLIHSLPYQGATIGSTFSLPSFYDHFDNGSLKGDYLGQLAESIKEFKEVL